MPWMQTSWSSLRTAFLIAVVLGPVCAATQAPRPPAGLPQTTAELVGAHVSRSRRLEPDAPTPGTDRELARLKEDIAQRSAAWRRRISRGPDAAASLLSGMPAATRARARGWATDPAGLTRALAGAPSLPLVLAAVAHRSLDVQAAWQSWRAVLRQFDQASFLEDLLVQYRGFVRELDTKIGPQTHREMTDRTFPFPSALSLRGVLIDLKSELARQRCESALRKALNDAARGYIQVRYTFEAVQTMEENRRLLAQMEELTRSQLMVGTKSQSDSLKAQAELATQTNEVELMRLQQASDIGTVNALMGLPATTRWGTPAPAGIEPRLADLDPLRAQAGRDHQDVRMARVEVEEGRAMVRMAEVMVLPRGSTGMSLIAPSAGAEAGPTRTMMATFPERPTVTAERATLGTNAAYIDELRVRVAGARKALEATRIRIDAAVQAAHVRARRSGSSVATYRDQVAPRARQAYDTVRERYSAGSTPFVEFLDAVRTYQDARLKVQEARRDLDQALVDVQDAVGRTAAHILGSQ